MASTSLLPASGNTTELGNEKRRISESSGISFGESMRGIRASLPIISDSDYYTEPSLRELAAFETLDPGYCSRVPSFVVGRVGYGFVKFIGETDVRGLDLNDIVKFRRHEVVVYEDESVKPRIGEGLNKHAEVILVLDSRLLKLKKQEADFVSMKLRLSMERQGAEFISFDPLKGEWKFLVQHFSRFGFCEDDDEEEDIMMDDGAEAQDTGELGEIEDGEMYDVDEENEVNGMAFELSHSLPAHLRLDPVKMREMRMVMFPDAQEEAEDFSQKAFSGKEYVRPLQKSAQRMSTRSSPPVARKTPLALIEYNQGNFDSNPPGAILMAQQYRGITPKIIRTDGFKLDLDQVTSVTGSHPRNLVDAGLFMGRSFRVGWGPKGVLVHTGAPIGSNSHQKVLSSVINVEKVAMDKLVRDENNKIREELVEFAFESPLNLHKGLDHESKEVDFGSCKLRLQRVVADRTMLSEICRSYYDIIEKELNVPGLSSAACTTLTHQGLVWELIRVLFSERNHTARVESLGADNEEDMMQDLKETCPDIDEDALPLVRRAEFSYWLQDSVSYHLQNDVSCLNESDYLGHIFVLLTGRQLDEAVDLAVSKGDVRLACLLSQAGGSIVNRSDVARQLDVWRINGLDFNFIEKGRMKLFELLSGDIQAALHDFKIDWRRFLGLLMWYQLPPDTSLPNVFLEYKHLVDEGRAPYPVPLYVDEGPAEKFISFDVKDHFDLSFYLMLLHSSRERDLCFLKTMFNASSSTNDPLDYHMIWHQRAMLEAVDVISSNDLHILDMGLVSQLLCLGKCHWAIYVILHMPHREDFPYLQVNLIREILFQYCESWSSDESHRQFIENLGVPVVWLHEAMAIYCSYNRDLPKALEHFLNCSHWQKAHTIFVTAIAHSLFLSGKDSEILRLAASMEDCKSEIENWDLGAGIYISYYILRNSLQQDDGSLSEVNSFESKNTACAEFFSRLKESLAVWGGRLSVETRVVYSKMAEEICGRLLSTINEGPTREDQYKCFETVFTAPIPEDLKSSHLQDAAALFTCFLSEVST